LENLMTVNHDAVAALPISGSASKTLLRNVNVARFPYVLFDADDSRNITLIDPSTGAITIDVMLFGRVFHYDPTDTTTVHDGTSCLVSADGLRYKLAVGTDVFAYAVINNTTSVPPVSPTLGDAYLVAAGATGAWAGKSNYIARKTNRGWEFINFDIGRFIYVESVDTYYHKNAGGAWVTGFGNQVTTPNSVPLSAAINFGKRILVENQTTTAPPGSPVVPTAYIIGPAATGAWSGLDGQIAICEVAGSFVIYNPTNGWEAYNKAKNTSFTFNGSAWASTAGAFINTASATYSANVDINTPQIPLDDTIPQISEGTQIITVGYTMKSTTNKLRLRLTGQITHNTANTHAAIAFFQDAIANALKATSIFFGASASAPAPIVMEHEYVPGTVTPLTISVRAGPVGSGSIRFNGNSTGRFFGGIQSVLLTLEEIPA
jgi:hypothetical protein